MEQYLDPEFGNRLKKARGKRTQAELAKAVGVSQGTVAKYEKGMMPGTNILKRISEELGVSLIFLVEGETDKKFLQQAFNVSEENIKYVPPSLEGTPLKDKPAKHPDPQIEAVIKMMETMDEETKKGVRLGVEKEKLLRELLQQKEDKKAG